MVAHSSVSGVCPQPEATVFCPAKAMEPAQRRDMALHALAGTETISRLAAQHEVSRKFVYQQVAYGPRGPPGGIRPRARRHDEGALPPSGDQAMVGASDPRLDVDLPQFHPRSLRVLPRLVGLSARRGQGPQRSPEARSSKPASYNRQQDLSDVRIGAHDEIFQSGRPVLVGADVGPPIATC